MVSCYEKTISLLQSFVNNCNIESRVLFAQARGQRSLFFEWWIVTVVENLSPLKLIVFSSFFLSHASFGTDLTVTLDFLYRIVKLNLCKFTCTNNSNAVGDVSDNILAQMVKISL